MEQGMLRPIQKDAVSQVIIDRITDALISGELKPGSKIPTEIEFSKSLGVGRNSVREATKILESFGVLEVRCSEGTFIASEFSQKMLDPLVYGLIIDNGSMQELLEFKLAFLRTILHIVVPIATQEDIDALQLHYDFLCETVKNTPEDENAIYTANREFHVALGQLTRNRFIIQINNVVMKVSKYSRLGGVRAAMKEGKIEDFSSISYHLLQAVKSRDVNTINPTLDTIFAYWKHLLI